MRLEGLRQLKNSMTSSGIEPATFQLVAYCLNQLRYSVPPDKNNIIYISGHKVVVVAVIVIFTHDVFLCCLQGTHY
jgi:hypothetical protein